MLYLNVSEEPFGNDVQLDYPVNFEVKLTPVWSDCMSVAVWISDGSCGFLLDTWAKVANKLGFEVSSQNKGLVCGGTEPVSTMGEKAIKKVLIAISKGRIHLQVFAIARRIIAIRTSITVGNGEVLNYNMGAPKVFVDWLMNVRLVNQTDWRPRPWKS